MKDILAHIAAERFLQAFVRLLLRRLAPDFDPQLPDKQAGLRHSQCITDQGRSYWLTQ